ncbi:hypothetical protein [Cryptosporidium hominis TU502]|uniref:hypothetical protein n=1 Tax=Cryptosporidium hominis (strain TU502) TaxID=353151 RepID=UPI0000453367|nr:hypothetical protein [Cryptosporidium hominis TU502]
MKKKKNDLITSIYNNIQSIASQSKPVKLRLNTSKSSNSSNKSWKEWFIPKHSIWCLFYFFYQRYPKYTVISTVQGKSPEE